MKIKKFFAALLALCMVLSILPMSVSAEVFDRSIVTGTAVISADHMVYFGQYGGSPVQWQVLNPTVTNAGGNGIFLISTYLLDTTYFGSNTTWAGSGAQQWCTNFTSNTSNFSTAESGAVLPITKADAAYSVYGASALSGEKAFFLSAQEAGTYFTDNTLRTAYFTSGSASHWWLRSPSNVDNAGTVNDSGALASGWCNLPLCTRPALNLNPSSVLFLSAAAGGKSNGAEGTLNAVSSVSMTPPKWKLTLLDNSRSGFSIATTAVAAESMTLSYSGAATGTNEYISAAFTDFLSGAVTYYGRIKHITDASDASGSVTIGIPAGVFPGANGTLVVFNEQYNGGASDNTYLTDYASPMRTVSNTVNAYALTVVNGTDSTGGSPYASGAQVSISADTAPAGQQFKEWVSNNGGTFDNAASASATFTMPAAAVTVTATYESIPLPGDAPALTEQPQNTSVSAGNTATFTVAATGTAPLSYQWQVDRNDGNGWQDVGTNSASYTTPTAQLSDSGYQYRCKVSNSAGEAISDPAVLMVTATWQPAFAVTGGSVGTDYTYGADGVLTFAQNGTYAVSMATPGATTTTDRIVVENGVTANITLDGVIIDVSGCAFYINGNNTVNLTLVGNNSLTSGINNAGLRVVSGASLTIGGAGALTATGGVNGAGIGGGNTNDGGIVTISGGTVTATGGGSGAGIGGGFFGSGGSVAISGGTVTATGGGSGAGIGGGGSGSGGSVAISGGTVTASGGILAAGIGGGNGGSGGAVTISGGIVMANGGNDAQDIGCGLNGGSQGTLNISGTTAVFLRNDRCPTPTTTTHAHRAITGHTANSSVYGVAVPWSDDFGAYLRLYTLSYDANGGQGTVPVSATQHIGTAATVAGGSGLSRTGYAFNGWNTQADGSGDGYAENDSFDFAQTTTLYAQWTTTMSSYTQHARRTLTDSATGVSVSGRIDRRTALTVRDISLHSAGTCAACDSIRARMDGLDDILLFYGDISLTRGFTGQLTVAIPVGGAYNGAVATLLHCKNGRLETLTATVANGEAVFIVGSLSPLAVFAAPQVLPDIPKTGGGGFPIGFLLLALCALAVMNVSRGKQRG